MNRRQMAIRIGGQHLLRAILRSRANKYRRRLPELPVGTLDVQDLTPEDAKALRLEWASNDSFQDEQLPHVMWAEPSELSDSEKAWIRGRFYNFVNMPLTVLRRWKDDVLVQDGTDKKYRSPYRARRNLRSLHFLKASTTPDGSGWRPQDYDTARRSIFVVQNLLHPRLLDYETWALLRNFGHDWVRNFSSRLQRKLPKKVEQQIRAARRAYEKQADLP